MTGEINNRTKIAQSFGMASRSYDLSSRLQRFSGKNLIPWLPQNKESVILDLGSGTGFFAHIFSAQYNNIFGLDISKQMLDFAQENRDKQIKWIQGDAHKLPLADESVDFIYSNLVLQWCDPLDLVINEVMRVLKPGGQFAFATLTDGTLHELKHAWSQADNDQHVIDFVSESKIENLMNSEKYTLIEHQNHKVVLEYENVFHLARELKGIGANILSQTNKGLSGKTKWQKMNQGYSVFKDEGGIYPASYYVYSGLVFKHNA